jgi:hypothetical protein
MRPYCAPEPPSTRWNFTSAQILPEPVSGRSNEPCFRLGDIRDWVDVGSLIAWLDEEVAFLSANPATRAPFFQIDTVLACLRLRNGGPRQCRNLPELRDADGISPAFWRKLPDARRIGSVPTTTPRPHCDPSRQPLSPGIRQEFLLLVALYSIGPFFAIKKSRHQPAGDSSPLGHSG